MALNLEELDTQTAEYLPAREVMSSWGGGKSHWDGGHDSSYSYSNDEYSYSDDDVNVNVLNGSLNDIDVLNGNNVLSGNLLFID